jgi:hypothetical protein
VKWLDFLISRNSHIGDIGYSTTERLRPNQKRISRFHAKRQCSKTMPVAGLVGAHGFDFFNWTGMAPQNW